LIDHKKLHQNTREMLELFSENINPKTPIKFLTIAKQQVVEILKALSYDPKVLILDEPTSSLTQVETKKLFENIRILKEQGISIIYISHHLQEIFEIADRATVLRDGKYVGTVDVADMDEEKIVNMMVGREVAHKYVPRQDKIDRGAVVLEAKGLCHTHLFRDVSFQVHKGEILGFAGLIGAGRTEMAKALFGLEKLTSGEIILNGRPISVKSPTDAMRQGIAYTSENRKLDGLFLSQSIEENCVSPQLKEFAGRGIGFLDEKRMADFARMCIDKFNIATPSMKQRVRNLSGGNQQKVLLSMWLGIEPKVLIVDEPTKGVDVGAKAEIYDILRALADTGVAIIVISSELLEVLTISDRIIVMKSGRIVGSMNNIEATEENVIAYATGAARA
jgi:ABC-type sugar transport system ATPase subunit